MNLKFWEKKEKTELEKAIDEQIDITRTAAYGSAEEKEAIENLTKLTDVKERLEGPKQRINPNTVINAIVTFGGIVLMLNYERLNVITSKALNFLPKPKL